MEKISIVITTYERNNTLERAINSVLNQTYPDFEVVVVDDNKNITYRQEVEDIINRINDPRIRLVQNKKNLGGALARNEGIKSAKGKYIAFLDDDDEYCPDKLSEQMKVFMKDKTEKLALVYCYCRGVTPKGSTIYHNDYIGNCVFEGMYECIAATSQWLCNKQALLSVGGFSDTPCKQDSTVIVKLLVAGYTIDRVPKVLSIYHDDGINRISSGNHIKKITGEENLRKLCRDNYYFLSARQKKEVEYSFACRLMPHYYAIHDRDNFKKAFHTVIEHPLKKSSLLACRNVLRIVFNK